MMAIGMQTVQAEIAAVKAEFVGLRAALAIIKQPAKKISTRGVHVIRLGQIFLDGYKATSFPDALGFKAERICEGYVQFSAEHMRAAIMGRKWAAYQRRPPTNSSEKTYREFTEFFSDHWPDIDWPSDIPRPTKSKKEAA